jgi:hypothetical protein
MSGEGLAAFILAEDAEQRDRHAQTPQIFGNVTAHPAKTLMDASWIRNLRQKGAKGLACYIHARPTHHHDLLSRHVALNSIVEKWAEIAPLFYTETRIFALPPPSLAPYAGTG